MKSQNHAKFISFYKNDLFKIFQNNDSHFKVFFALIIFLYTYLHVTNGGNTLGVAVQYTSRNS
uniref:Transmembrane protein n=1 Tax=Medicago truncatula TaxID=3880 RepID=I3T847_MEDTR|nr:unknown [Medicago truncatula]